MKIKKITKKHKQYPLYFQEIASPPKDLYLLGTDLDGYLPAVTIVGSRKLTPYGQDVTYRLSYDLAKRGITVVSGLALGADGVVHRAALDAGGRTIAVLAGGLDSIHPRSHRNLAIDILRQNGTLMSEYPAGMPPLKQHFVARNRLVSAISDMVVVTEAAEGSGSLITARFAIEQNKLVGAVPGNITSGMSIGANNLIKSGATPITSAQDILDALGLQAAEQAQVELFGDTEEEQLIIEIIREGVTELEQIQLKSKLDPVLFNQSITMLEISGKIRPLGAAHWTLR